MPARRELTMRQLRHLLRLHHAGTSTRQIARILNAAPSTIRDNLKRLREAGATWPLPPEMDDHALEKLLFSHRGAPTGMRRRIEPDWAVLVREMKRPGVTLTILHEEYKAGHPDGYRYSRFCELYDTFAQRLSPTMRQILRGRRQDLRRLFRQEGPDRRSASGEMRPAEIFVAVLGASNFTYAEATWTQACRTGSARMPGTFASIGGVPKLDRAGQHQGGGAQGLVLRPGDEPQLRQMAAHYQVGILPARPRKPRDKAKVEAGVLIAQS